MRPKRTRWIKCMPGARCFCPKGKTKNCQDKVYLAIDEFEAVRLADWEELTHAQAARMMKISRPTFTRILASGHKKISDGLVNIKTINIEGGCCAIRR